METWSHGRKENEGKGKNNLSQKEELKTILELGTLTIK